MMLGEANMGAALRGTEFAMGYVLVVMASIS